jgi:hypothetical protein
LWHRFDAGGALALNRVELALHPFGDGGEALRHVGDARAQSAFGGDDALAVWGVGGAGFF